MRSGDWLCICSIKVKMAKIYCHAYLFYVHLHCCDKKSPHILTYIMQIRTCVPVISLPVYISLCSFQFVYTLMHAGYQELGHYTLRPLMNKCLSASYFLVTGCSPPPWTVLCGFPLRSCRTRMICSWWGWTPHFSWNCFDLLPLPSYSRVRLCLNGHSVLLQHLLHHGAGLGLLLLHEVLQRYTSLVNL